MRDRLRAVGTWRLWAAAAALHIFCYIALPSPAPGAEYLLEDVHISGRQIHSFTDRGRAVTVVLGDFRLTLGRRSVTGRDAVLWIDQHASGRAIRHDITLYVEGDAVVEEPGRGAMADRAILLTMHNEGRILLTGRLSSRSLKDFPLYRRAREALRRGTARTQPAETGPGLGRPASPVAGVAPSHPPAATRPAGREKPPEVAGKPQPVRDVTFHAERVTWLLRGGRRIAVARGKVYLSRGDPDSDLFLELRGQAAVVFTEKRPAEEGLRDVRSPLGRAVPALESPLPGERGMRERITGVYLEGDVVISRGERYLRGPAAYYDFTTDRAIVPDGVFRTIQTQRNIPIYIRAEECRMLSSREMWFRNAKATTSDFYTPTWHFGAAEAYLMDETEYDEKGVRISPVKMRGTMRHATFNIRGVPVLYAPLLRGDFTDAHLPLRKATVGHNGRFGIGAETQWHLFRLLGLVPPRGYQGRVNFDWYERGLLGGVEVKYARSYLSRQYSGYWLLYGLYDSEQKDEFGDERELPAPEWRGRMLVRHKEVLPKDWTLQFELSYLCDRNFLEQFFPGEFYAGKEQETLVYAKKQRDNWAFTSLLKYRLNRFQTQTESMPELGLYLLGEPLLGGRLLYFTDSRAGFKRFRPAKGSGSTDSRIFGRLDSRHELDFPLHAGPLNITPYLLGRLTYWDDKPAGGETFRPYGQFGVKANMHFWRVFDGARSRLWDVNRLKHVITPEAAVFMSAADGVTPGELLPIQPDIEQRLAKLCGASFGIYQRLQTKRGRPGRRHTVDWMRFDVVAGFYDGDLADRQPANGRFFMQRPEYSVPRDHVNFDYAWNISDATALLADANYDIESDGFRRANVGLAVSRDPRLRYYLGARWIRDLDSAVGTFGFNYRISRKYSFSFFEQYDFKFDDGRNLTTNVVITRKFPRWYFSAGFSYDASQDDVGVYVSFWPEGIPELRLGGRRYSVLGKSDKN